MHERRRTLETISTTCTDCRIQHKEGASYQNLELAQPPRVSREDTVVPMAFSPREADKRVYLSRHGRCHLDDTLYSVQSMYVHCNEVSTSLVFLSFLSSFYFTLLFLIFWVCSYRSRVQGGGGLDRVAWRVETLLGRRLRGTLPLVQITYGTC